MSDDYTAVCHGCRRYLHFGQRMGGVDKYSLGHGGDDKLEQIRKEKQECIEFVMKHAWCNPVLGVQIILADPFMDSMHNCNYVNAEKEQEEMRKIW